MLFCCREQIRTSGPTVSIMPVEAREGQENPETSELSVLVAFQFPDGLKVGYIIADEFNYKLNNLNSRFCTGGSGENVFTSCRVTFRA